MRVIRHNQNTAKENYINDAGKRVGTVSLQLPTVMNNAALEAAMGGEAVRDLPAETCCCQLKCHDPSGDDYSVTFRERPSGSRPERTKRSEEWADTVGSLE
ncbi:MAG: hypothetical protein GX837_08960 [Methanomicrobiales archaeon]|jgi:arginyl-tRNA synthetase|nr:hypothetical protein [Methanomicrobiales archaeon]